MQGEQFYCVFDIFWDGVRGDLVINLLMYLIVFGDFCVEQGLVMQVFICLMIDCVVDFLEFLEGVENCGWLGDVFDLEVGEMLFGFKFWLLCCQLFYVGIEIKVEVYICEVLQLLIDQKVVVFILVDVVVDCVINCMEFFIVFYGCDGKCIFDQKFEQFWDQLNGVVNLFFV